MYIDGKQVMLSYNQDLVEDGHKIKDFDWDKEYYGVCFVPSKHNNGRMAYHYRPAKGKFVLSSWNGGKYPIRFDTISKVDLYGYVINSSQKKYEPIGKMHLFSSAEDARNYYEECWNKQLEEMDKLVERVKKAKEAYRKMI